MSIRECLIQFLTVITKTKGLTSTQVEKLKKTITLLNAKNPEEPNEDFAYIPDNEWGKIRAYLFTFFLFYKMPILQKNLNKKQVEIFTNDVENVVKEANEARLNPGQKQKETKQSRTPPR